MKNTSMKQTRREGLMQNNNINDTLKALTIIEKNMSDINDATNKAENTDKKLDEKLDELYDKISYTVTSKDDFKFKKICPGWPKDKNSRKIGNRPFTHRYFRRAEINDKNGKFLFNIEFYYYREKMLTIISRNQQFIIKPINRKIVHIIKRKKQKL